MAVARSDTGQVTVGVESAFGTYTSNPAIIVPKAKPDLGGLQQTYHEADKLRTGNHELAGVLGVKSDSTISLEVSARGYKSSAPTTFPELGTALLDGSGDETPLAVLMAAAIGNIHVSGSGGAFDTVQASPAPTTTTFSVADGSKYAEGQTIAVLIGSSYEAARIKTISSNAITLHSHLSAAPAATATVYAGFTIFPTQQPQISSLSMQVQGEDTDGTHFYATRILGMQPSGLKLAWTAKDFLTASLDFMVADFNRDTEITKATEYAAEAEPAREVLSCARMVYDYGSSSVAFDASAAEFDAGIDIRRPDRMTCGVQGVGESKFGFFSPRFTIDPLFSADSDWMDASAPFRAQTGGDLIIQIGTQPGRMLVLHVPNAHIVEDPTIGDRDGLMMNPLTFAPMLYTGDNSSNERSTTTPVNCPWSIAIL